jgi:hypothetical protein
MVGVDSSIGKSNNASGCNGNLISAGDLVGTETVCLTSQDGLTQYKISLTELRKWMHTFEYGSKKFLFETNEHGQLEGDEPPQY